MGSLSRSSGMQGRGASPRVDARRYRDQARLGDLGRYPGESDRRRAIHAVATRHGRQPEQVLPLADGRYLRAAVRPERPTLVKALVEAAIGEVLR